MTETHPDFETIRFDVRHRAAWITLHRPEVLNAFDPRMVGELGTALDRAEAHPEVAAVVLTGTGRAFCVGGDLAFVEQGMGGVRDARTIFLEELNALLCRLERFPKPVIAAVNGLALGGGLEVVLCCDLVLAATSARLGDVHANYGLLPGGGSSVRLPRKIGVTRAKWLLYTGEMVDAKRMREAGLVNEVVADEELGDAVDALVARLADKSPLAMRRLKALVDDGLEKPVEAALRAELVAGEAHAHSHDMREGIEAFREKRKPAFRGC